MVKKTITTKIQTDLIKKQFRNIKTMLKEFKVGEAIVKDLIDEVREDAWNHRTNSHFRDLKDATKKGRAYIAKHNKTHKEYSQNKPNLTITGRFLNSIKPKTTSTVKSIKWSIDATGTHKGYLSGSGERGPSISNKKLRNYLHEIGRDPLFISKKLKKKIGKLIKEEIRHVLSIKTQEMPTWKKE